MSSQELAELVRRIKSGDRAAFEQLVEKTKALGKRLAYSIVGPNLVDDALQESYMLIFQKIEQVREPDAFKSWFCRIVLHVCYTIKKKNPQSDELPEMVAGGSESEAVLASVALGQELSRMSQKHRDVLVLRELLVLSYDEIADTLKISGGTVRSRLHKARERLAEQMGGR